MNLAQKDFREGEYKQDIKAAKNMNIFDFQLKELEMKDMNMDTTGLRTIDLDNQEIKNLDTSVKLQKMNKLKTADFNFDD